MEDRKRIIVVTGPECTDKSELVVALAKRHEPELTIIRAVTSRGRREGDPHETVLYSFVPRGGLITLRDQDYLLIAGPGTPLVAVAGEPYDFLVEDIDRLPSGRHGILLCEMAGLRRLRQDARFRVDAYCVFPERLDVPRLVRPEDMTNPGGMVPIHTHPTAGGIDQAIDSASWYVTMGLSPDTVQ